MLHDTHIHLDAFDEPGEAIASVGYSGWPTVWVTTEPAMFESCQRQASGYANITVAPGLHPQCSPDVFTQVPELLHLIAFCGWVGEVGLDGAPEFAGHWAQQCEAFERVLEHCEQLGGRTLTVHSRRSAEAVIDRLVGLKHSRVVLHWFSGPDEQLDRAASAGCCFSVNPAMVRSSTRRKTVMRMPADRVLLETDGPYASIDGRPSVDEDLWEVVRFLSSIWEQPRESVVGRLERNRRAVWPTL
jgi:TatD DNase family protein